jgi:hypothetical protein
LRNSRSLAGRVETCVMKLRFQLQRISRGNAELWFIMSPTVPRRTRRTKGAGKDKTNIITAMFTLCGMQTHSVLAGCLGHRQPTPLSSKPCSLPQRREPLLSIMLTLLSHCATILSRASRLHRSAAFSRPFYYQYQ